MKICVLPGDGIGPEIMAQAVRVLNALDLPFEMEEALVGGCAVDATGNPLPEATLELARAADAILLGAVGGPKWDSHPRNQRPELGLLGIHKELALFANLRPAILYPELANASSLKPEIVAGLDILIVRELTGGLLQTLEERVGATSVQLDALSHSNRQKETNVGNFIADSYRSAVGADIGFVNGGSIRADLTYEPGVLTKRAVLSILPFNNPVVKVEISGKTLRQILEHGVARSANTEHQTRVIHGRNTHHAAPRPEHREAEHHH